MRLSRDEAEKLADRLLYRNVNETVIAVAQDHETREVLMVAYMNREAFVKTLTTGFMHYWSLSRRRIWMKGETSGNIQEVVDAYIDCDGDAVLFLVRQKGVACHEGYKSCFHNRIACSGECGD
ncbi:MAG: phosphoribosyl-AMP cyclohydrolase [Aigarchaeota archaeon]|jgi:phosphoribosyl-AMP cyclohydrolase|nr:phosphoribosyl-AMP cyclohydrolase [Candidatus Wolframiiraptor gerlachensis]